MSLKVGDRVTVTRPKGKVPWPYWPYALPRSFTGVVCYCRADIIEVTIDDPSKWPTSRWCCLPEWIEIPGPW